MKFSCCAIRRSMIGDRRAGAEHELLGLAHVDQRRDAAAFAHLRQLQRLLARGQRPPRDIELQVERAQLEVRLGDLADEGRQHRAPPPLAWRGAARAPPRWRGGSGPRSRAPTPCCPRVGGLPRCAPPSIPAAGVRPPPACTSALDARILVRSRDPELRLRLQHARRGEPHVVVLRRARCARAPAAARPGTPPTTSRRRMRDRRPRRSAPRIASGVGQHRLRVVRTDQAAGAQQTGRRYRQRVARRESHDALDPGAGVIAALRERDLHVASFSTCTNSIGIRKMASSVAASMPLITTVPRMRRDAAPDPSAIQSGTQPRMNANDVIRIGRSRSLRALERRRHQVLALLRSRALANSTIRIAFFAARPISMTTPICA